MTEVNMIETFKDTLNLNELGITRQQCRTLLQSVEGNCERNPDYNSLSKKIRNFHNLMKELGITELEEKRLLYKTARSYLNEVA